MRLRIWTAADHEQLYPLLAAYMHETPEYGYVVCPQNVFTLYNLGYASGLSTLAEKDGVVVGFTNWITSPLRYENPTCFGLGTYVVPAHRREGIAAKLHNTSAALAYEDGFVVCERSAHGGMGEPMLKREGWVLAGNTYRRDL